MIIIIVVFIVILFKPENNEIIIKLDKINEIMIKDMKEKLPGLKRYESIQSGSKSKTISKKNIYMCLHDKNKNIHRFNTLVFVNLHELAHVATDSIGHTPEFWDNFRLILKRAIKLGFYKYEDYSIYPIRSYCGNIDITFNPLDSSNGM